MKTEQEPKQDVKQEHDFWEIWFSSTEVLEELAKK